MKPKLLIGMCILILLIAAPAMASTFTRQYETTPVARIVGNSPSEMEQQLRAPDMELKHTTFFQKHNNDLAVVLYSEFDDDLDNKINDMTRRGYADDTYLNQEDFDQFQTNELLYIDNGIRNIDYAGLKRAAASKKPLFVYNEDYAGASQSLIKSLAKDSIIIASTFYSSDEFARALFCNLQSSEREIGDVFMQARNNYYWNSNIHREPIGLMLLSYMLYGMPTVKVKTPEEPISTYCEDYQEDFTITSNSDFQVLSTNQSNKYTKKFEFEIKGYEIITAGNHSLIETSQTINAFDLHELVLPRRTLMEEFPLNTIITGFKTTEMSDSADITANIPTLNASGQIDRVCYENKRNATIEFAQSYTENSRVVITNINPVEILDCEKGKFRLFKKFKYEIEYIPYSPVLLKGVSVSKELLPKQKENITVKLQNTQDNPVKGMLVLKDENKNVILAKNITTRRDKYDIELTAPEQEGIYNYRVDFYYQNESRTYKEFSFEVKTLDVELIAPEIVTDTADLDLIINSGLSSSFSTTIDYHLLHDGTTADKKTKTATISPGENKITLTFNNLDRSKIIYAVVAGVPYQSKYKTATATILTEHAPVIIQENVNIKENQSFSITPEIYDIDRDDVTSNIDYPFDDYDENWIASFEQSGKYDIKITADDSIKTSERIIKLRIDNVNRPPTIHPIETITIKENETFTIEPNATDPDNENSVANDDNNLTFHYASLFDENGTWTPDFDKSGNYTVQATVTDGEYYDDTYANIIVLNTNRPPVIDTNDTITVNEGDLITLDMLAYDPDNKNSVTNDDNELSVKVTAPLDENATWQTTDNDAGNYTITITVSDGQYNVTKDVTIIVQNLNRAPEIEGLSDAAVKEGETVQLTPVITDLDNQNNATNDDNQITITYPEPFDQNGTWHTTYEDSGEYNITVRVSDGITETTQNIIVYVANTNRAPEIQALPDINTTEGQEITITPAISDPDNQNSVANDDNQLTVTYSEIIPAEGTLELDYESSGEYTITATISDGELEAETSFKLKIDNVNRAPQVNAEDLHVKEGQTINYTALIFDPDNENNAENDDNELIVSLPPQFENNIWEISYEESGEYVFSVWAYDGEYNTSETITIIIDNVNRPPTLEEISDITAYEGETIQVNAVYSDPDNENSAKNDDNNLKIEYSPPLDSQGKWETNYFSAGTYDMTATVTDGYKTVVERFTITVQNQNRLPSIDSYEPETTITINEGESQTFKVNVIDPDRETPDLTWYLSGEQAGTGAEYEYTPGYTDKGTHEIKVTAKDSSGGDAEHTWTVHVENTNRAPEVQEIGILRVPEGDEAVITIEATDADEDELTYSINDKRFTQDNNTFTWQTTYQDSGTYEFEITVSDGQEETKQTAKVIVANFNHAPEITDYSPKQTRYIPHNKDFEFSIKASDADNETLTIAWYVDEEIKGTGETFIFNPQGELKEFNIAAKVTDGNATTKQEFTVESIDRPRTDSFDKGTTNLSEYSEEELTSISEFTIQKGHAQIKFLENVDLSSTTDLENNLLLENNKIALNTPELPALNKPARITFYNVQFTQNPVIYYSEGFAEDANEICPPELCYNIKYENNVLSFTAAHFTTYIIRETPFKQYHLQTPEKIILDAGETETEFTIRNSGLLDIKNLEITGMFNKGSFVLTPTKTDLEKGDTETIKIQGTAQRPPKAGRTEIGKIKLNNKDISKEIQVYLELEEKLNIGRLEINVGDKTYASAEDEDRIKAKPGSHIELEFMIENNLDELTIEDIIITAETDDDYDESDYFDITAGNYKTKILELDLPRLLDENRYDLVITVEGEDEKRTEYEIEWTINLRIDREKHETKIENLEISPAELKCDKETRITFDLVNYGTTDEENLKIDIQNKELDIDIQDYVSIQEASETEFRYRVIFDEYPKAGQHTIPVNIYYDDGQLADSKELILNILDCGAKTTTEPPETTIKAQATIKLDNSKPVLKNTGDNTFTLTAMLLMLLALLLILAGLLFLKAVY